MNNIHKVSIRRVEPHIIVDMAEAGPGRVEPGYPADPGAGQVGELLASEPGDVGAEAVSDDVDGGGVHAIWWLGEELKCDEEFCKRGKSLSAEFL